MIARAVIDFPLPDSPTIPTVSPALSASVTEFTIVSELSERRRSIRSPCTSSNGSAEAVAIAAAEGRAEAFTVLRRG